MKNTAAISTDPVRALIQKWRRKADENELHAHEADSIGIVKAVIVHEARATLQRENANELESALASAPQSVPVGVEGLGIRDALLRARAKLSEEEWEGLCRMFREQDNIIRAQRNRLAQQGY